MFGHRQVKVGPFDAGSQVHVPSGQVGRVLDCSPDNVRVFVLGQIVNLHPKECLAYVGDGLAGTSCSEYRCGDGRGPMGGA